VRTRPALRYLQLCFPRLHSSSKVGFKSKKVITGEASDEISTDRRAVVDNYRNIDRRLRGEFHVGRAGPTISPNDSRSYIHNSESSVIVGSKVITKDTVCASSTAVRPGHSVLWLYFTHRYNNLHMLSIRASRGTDLLCLRSRRCGPSLVLLACRPCEPCVLTLQIKLPASGAARLGRRR
jgi:hypothetical protein